MFRLRLQPALAALALAAVAGLASSARADGRVVEVRFTPVARAQMAIWIEHDGALVRTVALTRAVAYRGIGNRPGALQMNSGYRWPFGRREGVLPVWAHRRAAAPGARSFGRVIFQARSEGAASGGTSSLDAYYCLSFRQETTRRDALDAVSCASTFNSDKGRYVTAADVAAGYAEPYETTPGAGMMRLLDTVSLYPPRRDLVDHAFVALDSLDAPLYFEDARRVMPELDAITTATPAGGVPQLVAFRVPDDWADGPYELFVEVGSEGDYAPGFDDRVFPTPRMPPGTWDSWAMGYGYPYRGQPSVVFRVPFGLTSAGATTTGTAEATGYGSVDGTGPRGGDLRPMDGRISNDPIGAPGSGVDRLRIGGDGNRVSVRITDASACLGNLPPGGIDGTSVARAEDIKHSHEWARLQFTTPTDDGTIMRYEVRVGTQPIVDEISFLRAQPAGAATIESEALEVPVGGPAGENIDVMFGGLMPETHYYVGVRAVDDCAAPGPISVSEVTTTAIHFTVVSPCFVATAAWGSPLADEVGALRRFRDRHLRTNAPGRAFVSVYETVGPVLADAIRPHESARAAMRTLLTPIVEAVRALDGP